MKGHSANIAAGPVTLTAHIAGLSPEDAHELVENSISRSIEAEVAERIVAEAGGNPLAVVEATAR